MSPTPAIAAQVLAAFDLHGAKLEPLGAGLINQTFSAEHEGARWVVQCVNPIFSPEVNDSIEAVGRQLRAAGVQSPKLRSAQDGRNYLRHHDQVWRVMERLDGHSFDRATTTTQVERAARFVARWHQALESFEHEFRGQRHGVHDTATHLSGLRDALRRHGEHRLAAPVNEIAAQLELALTELPPLPAARFTVAHGDLKLNNLLFEKATQIPQALIDLDTVGPMLAAHELGDALRSWCNRAGEDDDEAHLDLGLFEATTHAYLEASPQARRDELAASMWLGADWISLELTARFLADTLNESYFGFDAQRFNAAGEHNLERARGQWSLHQAFAQSRHARGKMLGR